MVTTTIGELTSGADVRVAPSYGLNRLLAEFESLLRVIPPEAYYAVTQRGQAPIARHVDHCLDLIETLLSVGAAHVIAYQAWGGVVGDLDSSLRRIRELRNLGLSWPGRSLDGIICVEQTIWSLGLAERGWSTLGDELAFVVNHVVDSQKMIERSMNCFGFDVPKGFGTMQLQPLRARSSAPPAWELWRLLDELESLLTEVASDVYCARFATEVSGSVAESTSDTASITFRPCSLLIRPRRCPTIVGSVERRWNRPRRGRATDSAAEARSRGVVDTLAGRDDPRHLDDFSLRGCGDRLVDNRPRTGFCVSHTIHHQAIIGVLLAFHGHAVPERFGHSPSTPRRN